MIAGYSYRTRESYVRQGTENVEHILELYMQVLDDRIVSADEYLIREADDNLYAVQLKNAATEKDAGLSPYFFWQDLYARVRNSVEADAYFFLADQNRQQPAGIKKELVCAPGHAAG